jgi:AraC-like DNA-binding protein
VFKLYRFSKNQLKNSKEKLEWQQKISYLFIFYVISYVIYGLSLIKIIEVPEVFYVQAVILASLVIYIAYISFTQPNILGNTIPEILPTTPKKIDPLEPSITPPHKYQKSGLTADFSLELKDHLFDLLLNDKIYKINNITLDMLAQKLETNRHNASQVINEHFHMNFFELINKYRIKEAQRLLEDENNHMNIIDIAYEVGYNNKVTFNKSFKKETAMTPTIYQENFKQKKLVTQLNDVSGNSNLFSGSGN